MSEGIGRALQKGRQAKGWSQEQLAKQLGISRAAVGQWERGDTEPSTSNLIEVCRLLGLDVQEVTRGNVFPVTNPSGAAALPLPVRAIIERRTSIPDNLLAFIPGSETTVHSDIPIYAAFPYGSDGDFSLAGSYTGFLPRQPSMNRIVNAYAMYVTTPIMSPRYEVGELIIISPSAPAKAGDYVVVATTKRDELRLIWKMGRLASRTAKDIKLEQFLPQREVNISVSDLAATHRILGMWDLL